MRCIVSVAVCVMLGGGAARAQENESRKEDYYRAVRYCRESSFVGIEKMKLSPDKQILCFDGAVGSSANLALAKNLTEGGLFVVRSTGGLAGTAIAISDVVRDRRASVVVYDYCFSACALFFLVASHRTYVLRGTVVAWHNVPDTAAADPLCTYLNAPADGGAKKLRRGSCEDGSDGIMTEVPLLKQFFKDRVTDAFDAPPDSLYVRKQVAGRYAESGVYRDIGWTLHPRYYPGLFKASITYEAYPESQDEVDKLLAYFWLDVKVIYDP